MYVFRILPFLNLSCVGQVALQTQLLDAAKAGRPAEIAQLLDQGDLLVDFKDWVSEQPRVCMCICMYI